MEDALRAKSLISPRNLTDVLILVLMEDALRDDKNMYVLVDLCDVLILVLMEDALRDYTRRT